MEVDSLHWMLESRNTRLAISVPVRACLCFCFCFCFPSGICAASVAVRLSCVCSTCHSLPSSLSHSAIPLLHSHTPSCLCIRIRISFIAPPRTLSVTRILIVFPVYKVFVLPRNQVQTRTVQYSTLRYSAVASDRRGVGCLSIFCSTALHTALHPFGSFFVLALPLLFSSLFFCSLSHRTSLHTVLTRSLTSVCLVDFVPGSCFPFAPPLPNLPPFAQARLQSRQANRQAGRQTQRGPNFFPSP